MNRAPTSGDRAWVRFALLALITLAAAVLRFWRLDAVPPGFHYDEAYEALEAWRVLTQPGYHPIVFPGNFGVEPAFIYLASLAFALAEPSPAVMRGVAALVGTLTVPALYGLVREMRRSEASIPPATALLAATVLTFMRWHIHFSRVGIEPILVPFALVLILWALWRAVRTNSTGTWIALGVATGASLYTYIAARLLPMALAIALASIVLSDRSRLKHSWRGFVVAALVALAVVAPLLLNWLEHPDQLLLRSSQIAFGGEGGSTGSVWDNLAATLLGISVRGDLDPRNNVPGMPALDVLISIPFYVGLAVAAWHWRRPAFFATLAAGLVMLAPTILSEFAPHFRRAVGATPPAAILAGFGLALMLGDRARAIEDNGAQPARPLRVPAIIPAHAVDRLRAYGRLVIVTAILIGSACLNSVAYFQTWGKSHALYYAYDEGLWDIGQYFATKTPVRHLFLSPRPSQDMTLAFAWRNGPAVTHFDGRHAFVAPESGPATYLIITHEDFRGKRVLSSIYPDARQTHSFLDRDGRLYAQAYQVADASLRRRQPQHAATARWEDLSLLGYDLNRPRYRAGEIVYLQLWWKANRSAETDWTVFVHLLGPARPDGNRVWAGQDARPGQGSVPTSTWQAGDRILDEYQLVLPTDAAPGDYDIEIGLYDPVSGGRRAALAEPSGQDHVIAGKVTIN